MRKCNAKSSNIKPYTGRGTSVASRLVYWYIKVIIALQQMQFSCPLDLNDVPLFFSLISMEIRCIYMCAFICIES